jgi:hypothetical protein
VAPDTPSWVDTAPVERLRRDVASRRRKRAIAALTAVMFIACGLLVAWHQAAESHAVCSEHGEQVHVAGSVNQPARGVGPSSRIERSPREHDEDAHGHCHLLAATRDEIARDIVDDVGGVHHFSIAASVAMTTRAVYDSTARYRLAPKTSPPV